MGNLHTHISFPCVLMMNVNLKIPHIYLQGHISYKKKVVGFVWTQCQIKKKN
jgi:hypothetical protein